MSACPEMSVDFTEQTDELVKLCNCVIVTLPAYTIIRAQKKHENMRIQPIALTHKHINSSLYIIVKPIICLTQCGYYITIIILMV